MRTNTTALRTLVVLPFFLLAVTRLVIEISVGLLPMRWAWLPAFGGYYFAILASLWYARRWIGIDIGPLGSFRPWPPFGRFFWGVLIPALLPLGVFLPNVQAVPVPVLVGILVFACINPFFEDAFWRGLLIHLPFSAGARTLFSATLFSFSHYFLWGAYWLSAPHILIPTCVSTFIMGICWMWFYQRDRRLLYPIVSHILVDIFNLSIAVFMGLPLPALHR